MLAGHRRDRLRDYNRYHAHPDHHRDPHRRRQPPRRASPPPFFCSFSLADAARHVTQSTLSTYIGTIRGQVTQEVFTITGVQRGSVAPPWL